MLRQNEGSSNLKQYTEFKQTHKMMQCVGLATNEYDPPSLALKKDTRKSSPEKQNNNNRIANRIVCK
jgi:hypothetical protein